MAHPRPEARIVEKSADRVRQHVRTPRWHEQPLDVMADDLPTPSDVREHERRAARRSLDRGPGYTLPPGRQDEHVHHRHELGDVLTPSDEQHVGGCPVQLLLRQRVPLVHVALAHDQEPGGRQASPNHAGGLEQLSVALLRDDPAHHADHELLLVDPQVLPCLGHALFGGKARLEAREVESVSEVNRPARPDDPEPTGPSEVLGRLVQLEVAASGGEPLGGEHRGLPREPVVRRGVQAVHGVHDARDADDAGRDPPHHTGLGVVRVYEVVSAVAQDADELAERPGVGARGPGPGRARPRDVPDPSASRSATHGPARRSR